MGKTYNSIRRFCAVIVGIVFFVAGMLKVMDPVGAGLVVEEYFKFFHVQFLAFAAKWTAFLLALLECAVGILLLAGIRRQAVALLTSIVLGFFTIITLILMIFNPSMECGCFGEAIHLTPLETFLKNLLLCFLCVVAFLPAGEYGEPRKSKGVAACAIALLVLVFSIYSQMTIPMRDFTDFAPGAELLAAQGNGSDQIEDYVSAFVYEKNGKEGSFTLDKLPDSTWTFVRVDTYSRSFLEDESAVPVLSISDLSGENVDSIAAEGPLMIASVYDPDKMSTRRWSRVYGALSAAASHGMKTLLLVSSVEDVPQEIVGSAYSADRKILLTLNRSNGGRTFVNDGEIISKWAWRSRFDDKSLDKLLKRNATESRMMYSTKGRLTFQIMLLYSISVLLLV